MKKPSRLIPILVYLLIFTSGLGLGYIYGTNREIKIMSMVVCRVSGLMQ